LTKTIKCGYLKKTFRKESLTRQQQIGKFNLSMA